MAALNLPEYYADLAQTTVGAGGYTSGSGSLLVVSLGQLLGDFFRDLWKLTKDPDTGLWVPQPVGSLASPLITLG